MSKEFKVVMIIDDYTLVLNAGSTDGINLGDEFVVYALSKEDIIDPDTGESLGKLEMVHGHGKVDNLQEKLCAIKSIEKKNTVVRIKSHNEGIKEEIREEILPFSDYSAVGDIARKI